MCACVYVCVCVCERGRGTEVLAQKQTYRSVEQNKKPRNVPPTIWSANQLIDRARKNIQWKKKTVSSTNGAGKTGQQHAEEQN